MKGRKPKPTRLRVLEGNPGKRPLPDGEPSPDLELPECPEHLGEHARAEWDRIGADLLELGLLTAIDRSALAAYCAAYGRWVEAEEDIRENGVLARTKNGHVIQSPMLAVANKALDQMKAFLVEFGMTPSSRARLGVRAPSGGKKGDGNAFGELDDKWA